MENIDKGLTVPKCVLINRSKITQMPQNLSAQIVGPSQKVWDFDEKRLHWASVVCGWAAAAAKASMDVSHGFAYFIGGPRSIVGGRFKHPLATIKQLLASKRPEQ